MKKQKRRALCILCSAVIAAVTVASPSMEAYATGVEVIGAGQAFGYVLGLFGVVMADQTAYESGAALEVKGAQALQEYEAWACEQQEGWTVEDSPIHGWVSDLQAGIIDTSSEVYDSLKTWIGTLRTHPSISPPAGGYKNAYALAAVGVSYGAYDAKGKYQGTITLVSGSAAVYMYACTYKTSKRVNFYSTEPMIQQWHDASGELRSTVESNEVSVDGYLFYELQNSLCFDLFSESAYELYAGDAGLIGEVRAAYVSDVLVGGATGDSEGEKPYVHVPGLPDDVWERDNSYDNVNVSGTIDWDRVGYVPQWLADLFSGAVSPSDLADAAGVAVTDKATDVPEENDPPYIKPPSEMEAYTLAGLEKLFPFCLPFDMIDFLNVLSAEPEAPYFEIPIRYPTLEGMSEYKVVIDLSLFDGVAAIVRNMECLAFIVGLCVLTRDKMIRG